LNNPRDIQILLASSNLDVNILIMRSCPEWIFKFSWDKTGYMINKLISDMCV